MLLTSFDTIPDALRVLPSWITALCTPLPSGRIDKVPLSPLSGRLCDVTDPRVPVSLDVAVAALRRGVGTHPAFCLRRENGIVCTDEDDCVDASGSVHPDAARILARLASYAELSLSGFGLHSFARGLKPGARCRRSMSWGGQIEQYDRDRFIVITGRRLAIYPGDVQPRQTEIEQVYRAIFGDEAISAVHARPLIPTAPHLAGLSDDELIGRMMRGRNGARIRRLLIDGDTGGYPSPSEADLGLLNDLAYYTSCDSERMRRIFLRSRLVRPKSAERDDYLDRTIQRAIASVQTNIAARIARKNGGSQ